MTQPPRREGTPGQKSEASSDEAAATPTTSLWSQAPDHHEGRDDIPFIDAPLPSTNTVRNAEQRVTSAGTVLSMDMETQ